MCKTGFRIYWFYLYFLAFVVPQILKEICSDDITPTIHLESQQALVKQFAEIIEFVLKFDEYKVCFECSLSFEKPANIFNYRRIWSICFQMRTPSIQNDFSYYRRMLMRQGISKRSKKDEDENSNTNVDVANKVSLFYAEATPMLRTLSDVTSTFLYKVMSWSMRLNAILK